MGYWEKVGKENRKRRRKRAATHPFRRKLSDYLETLLIVAASLMLWAIMLAPLWFFR